MVKLLVMLLPWLMVKIDELIVLLRERRGCRDQRVQGCRDEEV